MATTSAPRPAPHPYLQPQIVRIHRAVAQRQDAHRVHPQQLAGPYDVVVGLIADVHRRLRQPAAGQDQAVQERLARRGRHIAVRLVEADPGERGEVGEHRLLVRAGAVVEAGVVVRAALLIGEQAEQRGEFGHHLF
ncbi:hypothetical protein V7793_13725 [Streptomyces sp. KLMMK]|uniref:hypothetical protein n=1 Tax=Streptomyces sp. KLMMK TaxID=3109353 RepID=UPI00300B470D